MSAFNVTPSGVRVHDDFRANLIIDRYDPIFIAMAGKKIKDLRSENSEDAITWNVFRSLRQIDPQLWLPTIFHAAFGLVLDKPVDRLKIDLWRKFPPPDTIAHPEGQSEVDIALETRDFVWFIEAKYKSDISPSVKHCADRDQIIRSIDVGSCYAKAKDFYFTLLMLDPELCPVGVGKMSEYMAQERVCLALPHRPDGRANLKAISQLTWADLASVLADCAHLASRRDERAIANRAVSWLATKDIRANQETRRMTLHEAIKKLLKRTGKAMSTKQIADVLNSNGWYQKKHRSLITAFQIHGRTKNYPQLFERQRSRVSLKEQLSDVKTGCREAVVLAAQDIIKRKGVNEVTVLEIADLLLSKGTPYSKNTIRTHVTSRLCANAPRNHGSKYSDFMRISRGLYRLLNEASTAK
jgi:hypothetical protein